MTSISGIQSTLQEVSRRTTEGGSSFTPINVIHSPARAPLAFFTVLFRPSLLEAHSKQTAAAGIESTFLLLLTLVRLPWLWNALKSLRRRPYVAFCVVYSVLFILAYAAVGNFGLLVRQRTSLFPLFLVLLSIPSARASERFKPTPVQIEERLPAEP